MVLERVFIAYKPYPGFGGQELLLVSQESQTPLYQHGRIPSSFLATPRPVPLYCIFCLLGSVCGVDFIPCYPIFLSTTCVKCSLGLVSFGNADQMVGMLDVYFGVYSGGCRGCE